MLYLRINSAVFRGYFYPNLLRNKNAPQECDGNEEKVELDEYPLPNGYPNTHARLLLHFPLKRSRCLLPIS